VELQESLVREPHQPEAAGEDRTESDRAALNLWEPGEPESRFGAAAEAEVRMDERGLGHRAMTAEMAAKRQFRAWRRAVARRAPAASRLPGPELQQVWVTVAQPDWVPL
jgi:hypothetical protein